MRRAEAIGIIRPGMMPRSAAVPAANSAANDLWTRAKRGVILGKVPEGGRWRTGLGGSCPGLSIHEEVGYEKTLQVMDVFGGDRRGGHRDGRYEQRHCHASLDPRDQAHA